MLPEQQPVNLVEYQQNTKIIEQNDKIIELLNNQLHRLNFFATTLVCFIIVWVLAFLYGFASAIGL